MLSCVQMDVYKKEKYRLIESKPFIYNLDNNIYLHIELEYPIKYIWFDNDMKSKQKIPDGFNIYDSKSNIVNSFRNTETYMLNTNEQYIIYYNNNPIMQLETEMYLTIPATVEHNIVKLSKR